MSSNKHMGPLDPNLERPDSPARYLYTSDVHFRKTIDATDTFRRSQRLCDVVLLVGDTRLYAHRVILAACSPYFDAMFCSELLEKKQSEIRIYDIDEKAMISLIDYCYTSKIIVEESNVQQLLPAACILQLDEIQNTCCEFLQRQLDATNCLGIRSFADTHSCSNLLRISDKFIQHNFEEVMQKEEYNLVPVDQLIDIIKSDELNVEHEENVYTAVMLWIKYDLENRKQYLLNVLEHVRLPLISAKFIVGIISKEPVVMSVSECRDLVDEAKNYLLLPQERTMMQGPRTKIRKPLRTGEILYAGLVYQDLSVGGWCSGDAIATMERFDPQQGEWKMVAPMIKRRCGVGVAVLYDVLYAVGGHDGQCYLNSIEKYNPQLNQWSSDVTPTSSCRTSVGVAILQNHLYAVGGQDGVSCLNFVERYDPQMNIWKKVASMNTRRLGVGVAVLNGFLYAVGGSDGITPLDTVERYDPRLKRWSMCAPMTARRKHLGVAVYNNNIYAVGGRDDITELSSAEMYNPTLNKWTPMISMTSRRSGVGLAVVNGQLMAIGGFDGAAYLKTVEVFCFETNQWKIFGGMNYRRLGGGVGVVKMPTNEDMPW